MLKQLILAFLIVQLVSCMVLYDISKGNESIAESVLNAIDKTINPCDDFYLYACGNWIKNATIPEDKPRWHKAFSVIDARNAEILKSILLDHPEKVTDTQLLAFFKSCVDTDHIEQQGVGVVNNMLDLVNYAARDLKLLFGVVGFLHSFRIDAFWNFHVEIDAKNPQRNLGTFTQSGLNLPDRSFYLDQSDEGQKLLNQYKDHIAKMFALFNVPNATLAAEQVVEVEKKIATISYDGSDIRDPFKTYNLLNLQQIQAISPNINWESYLKGAAIPAQASEFNVMIPHFFANTSRMFDTLSLDAVSSYLRFMIIHNAAEYLPSAYRNENFNFFGKIILGEEEQEERSSYCITSTDESIGMLLSKYFVDASFSGESKTLALQMLHNVENAFQDTLTNLDWMDQDTRNLALKKLTQVADMIGFPDQWPTYDGLEIKDNYSQNKFNSRQFSYQQMLDTLLVPADRRSWDMTPETVNAYYDPTRNIMVFPAAILQNPYFAKEFPSAMTYGGAGMIMGHELSHGFDDQGRLYDGTGKLQNWWSESTDFKFRGKAQCLSSQYSKFSPLPGYFVNGNLTLGENIADNAGIKDSYKALSKLIGPEGLASESIVPGYTNGQLFFLSFSQGWCDKARPEFIKARLVSDVHSPAKFRVIGPLQNLPSFSEHFKCSAGSYMNPVNKCELF